MSTSTQRGKALYRARRADGWHRLNAWLEPQQAAKLEQIRNGRSDRQVLADLLSQA
ncbi:hypothetical protein D3C85_1151870 [compost metagenome]